MDFQYQVSIMHDKFWNNKYDLYSQATLANEIAENINVYKENKLKKDNDEKKILHKKHPECECRDFR
ncbi:hypothetical protein RCL_jg9408.t1 [Rhizophagus clarus]|uniref:Uncharacterized protein n=1 Tax=Rhizophagus clarus TaxID=94130 RepID=A0A8H3MAC1_9GLOM|nr:hypothetical protein RCL_jg9408.t1 [Rhizophagus clarus]